MTKYIFACGVALLAVASGRAHGQDERKPNETEKTSSPRSHETYNRQIDAALARFSTEPTLEDLTTAALKRAEADRESVAGWQSAPNLSAILPTLKIVADYGAERDESLDRHQDEPDRWGADTDNDLGFQLVAQWELDELIFNADEVRVYNAIVDRASRREAVLTLLVGYYYERRRIQLENFLIPPLSLSEALMRKIRIAELTASIDALTGGLLSSRLEKIRDHAKIKSRFEVTR